MTGAEAHARYQAFCNCPKSDDLIRYLPDLSERAAAQLLELARQPTPERAERMRIELDGARQLIAKLREALLREGCGDDACR